jgi:hypothetical protein
MKSSAALKNMVATWRIILFGIILITVFLIYTGRLFNLQIVQYSDWLAKSNENRTHEINLPATRGMIYDRNGFVLARNIPSYNAVITPAYLPDDVGEVQNIYRALSDLTGIPVNRGEVSTDNPFVPCISDHGITQIVIYGETTAPFGNRSGYSGKCEQVAWGGCGCCAGSGLPNGIINSFRYWLPWTHPSH